MSCTAAASWRRWASKTLIPTANPSVYRRHMRPKGMSS
ncbi:hypothetical protein HJG60_017041 [Phyllostomus discolor]|uniref:Uncharacterized protein n=1 Tax=Phyllostomus discolor TaxID=89673 RepID=A0A833ZCC7_9CHIR|nr:hypothetical protein HJG60_017041 [Phyllostomus discolor]